MPAPKNKPEESKYNYAVQFVIDVKRTDGRMLTNDENAMVEKMRVSTHAAIAKVMADHGQNNRKHLKDEMVIY